MKKWTVDEREQTKRFAIEAGRHCGNGPIARVFRDAGLGGEDEALRAVWNIVTMARAYRGAPHPLWHMTPRERIVLEFMHQKKGDSVTTSQIAHLVYASGPKASNDAASKVLHALRRRGYVELRKANTWSLWRLAHCVRSYMDEALPLYHKGVLS